MAEREQLTRDHASVSKDAVRLAASNGSLSQVKLHACDSSSMHAWPDIEATASLSLNVGAWNAHAPVHLANPGPRYALPHPLLDVS